MIPLPIDATLPQIQHALRAHNALILTAPPGAGKTTRVPPALLPLLSPQAPNLIMLQPRRVAARAAAQRIADEQHWTLGHHVGYHIRFEKRYTPKTRIRILTEAILTRILLDDPSLENVGCVILDEFHERSLHTDLAIAFLRDIQQTIRPDLKLLIMSATLDAQKIADFLQAPILQTHAQSHPLQIHHRPVRNHPLESHITALVDELSTQSSALCTDIGHILVFLPGKSEIDRTHRTLTQSSVLSPQSLVLPLHSSLSSEQQQLALAPSPTRKIILATNIAETSLTIDGVRTVIDSGLARIPSFDPDRGMDRLDLLPISKASATQRAGRAARQAPGQVFRLYSQQDHQNLPHFTPPEIHRVDLAPTLLAVHAWSKDISTFQWFDPPPEEILAAAEKLLTLLGALQNARLTPLGQQMLKLPTHPRLARLLIPAAHTPLQPQALTLATILSDPSPPSATARGNPLSHLEKLPDHLTPLHQQLTALINQIPKSQTQHLETRNLKLETLLLLAYPDRVAKRRAAQNPLAALMVGNGGGNIALKLAPESLTPALAAAPLFLALDPHHDPRDPRAQSTVRTAIPLSLETLAQTLPAQLTTQTALEYDPTRKKVLAHHRQFFADLLLDEKIDGHVDPQTAGQILAQALAPQAPEIFLASEPAARLLARIALLRHHLPEQNWPPFDQTQLQQALTQACQNKRSHDELIAPQNLLNALHTFLPYPLDRKLEELAPETITVPSGSKIKIDYPPPSNFQNSKFKIQNSPPTLSVRLQELFGLLQTPRIADGRVPLLLHLLSPGYKPIQITSDLKSFWSAAYFQVRKDLRARYPKHHWPEDPLTAVPQAKGGKKRNPP